MSLPYNTIHYLNLLFDILSITCLQFHALKNETNLKYSVLEIT